MKEYINLKHNRDAEYYKTSYLNKKLEDKTYKININELN